MLIKRLILPCIIAVATASFAKDTDSCFNLKTYVPPAFNYNLLELRPDISLNGEKMDNHSSSCEKFHSGNLQTDDFNSYNYNRPSMGLEARHSYYGWRGRTEWQIGNELSFYGGLSHHDPYSSNSSYSQGYASEKDMSFTISGKTVLSAAYYFKWPWFFGGSIAPFASGDMSRYKDIAKGAEKIYDTVTADITSKQYRFRDSKTDRKNYSADVSVNCRVGTGHIDDVSFAIAALNILDIFAETNNSISGCSSKQVQELASLIEKVRKRRVFDSRIARIENVDTLCKLITDMGIIDKLTPRTILEIADQWDYAFYQTRKKGFLIELCPTVRYLKSSNNNYNITSYSNKNDLPGSYSLTNNTKNEFYDNCSTLEYELFSHSDRIDYSTVFKAQYELPMTRYFQCGFDARVAPSIVQSWNSGKTWVTDPYTHTRGVYPALSAEETGRLGFFPNTRTSITISELVKYTRMYDYSNLAGSGYELYDLSNMKDLDDRHLSAELKLNGTYYVSPQLKIHVICGVTWSDAYRRSYGQLPMYYEKPSAFSNKEFIYQLGGDVVWGIF